MSNDNAHKTTCGSKVSSQEGQPKNTLHLFSQPDIIKLIQKDSSAMNHVSLAKQPYDVPQAKSVPDNNVSAFKTNVLCRELFERQKNGETLKFGGNRCGEHYLVCFIPKREVNDGYREWASSMHGLQQLIAHLSNGKRNEISEEPTAARTICDLCSLWYPKSFQSSAAETAGLVKEIKRMTAVESVAVAKSLNVSNKTLVDKLGRHLSVHFNGIDIIAPKSEIEVLHTNRPKPDINVMEFKKDDLQKKSERVHSAMYDVCDILCREMARNIMSADKKSMKKPYGKVNTKPLHDYPIPGNETDLERSSRGIIVAIGTDHGHEACQFSARMITEPPMCRKRKNAPEHGTIDTCFGVIKCKHDYASIVKISSPYVNKGLETLRTSKMIGIENADGIIKCIFVKKTCTSVLFQGRRVISINSDDTTDYDELPADMSASGLKFFLVVQNFHVIQYGDLCAQMMLQGRNGMSSCRCLKCNLKQSQ